jgi:hypothetical protein
MRGIVSIPLNLGRLVPQGGKIVLAALCLAAAFAGLAVWILSNRAAVALEEKILRILDDVVGDTELKLRFAVDRQRAIQLFREGGLEQRLAAVSPKERQKCIEYLAKYSVVVTVINEEPFQCFIVDGLGAGDPHDYLFQEYAADKSGRSSWLRYLF